jgi:ParB family transcriptional regulator, chromosome partitioning protein
MPESITQNQNKKKSSLGRGLGSLLGGADLASPMDNQPAPAPQVVSSPKAAPTQISDESQVWTLPIERLQPNTQQPRQVFSQEAIKELAASIKEKGILQPIVARRLGDREFQIIAGERRWRAAQVAGLKEVPVILKKVTEQDSLEYAIIENIQRENLNPIEEGEAYELLMTRYSLTQQQVADKLGKDRSTVANLIRLLTLPSELRDLVQKNELSAGHAKVLLGLDDPKDQLTIGKQIVSDKLSVRATEKLVAKTKTEKRQGAQPEKSALNINVSQRLLEGLVAELQKLVGTKVAIDYTEGKGKLQLHFYSDDQLNQIVEKMRLAWEK